MHESEYKYRWLWVKELGRWPPHYREAYVHLRTYTNNRKLEYTKMFIPYTIWDRKYDVCMYVWLEKGKYICMYIRAAEEKTQVVPKYFRHHFFGFWEGWWCEMMDCFCFICILCLFFASLIRIHVHGTEWDLVGGLLLLTFICLPACLSVHRPAPYVCLHFEKRVWNICGIHANQMRQLCAVACLPIGRCRLRRWYKTGWLQAIVKHSVSNVKLQTSEIQC